MSSSSSVQVSTLSWWLTDKIHRDILRNLRCLRAYRVSISLLGMGKHVIGKLLVLNVFSIVPA